MAGGGGKVSITTPRLNGIQIQSSLYGSAIARGWGTFRVSGNLLWYGDFQAIAQTSKTKSGGKGGGGKVSNTTYSYKASFVMGIASGPITSVRTVYRDQSVTQGLGGTGLSLVQGSVGQTPWGYLQSRHPDAAIGYSGIAYVYAQGYDLSDSATLGNHSFEVQSGTRVLGLDDANPADIVSEFLSEVPYWQAGLLGDLSDYSKFCLASDYLLSPVLEGQTQGSSFLKEILTCSNSDCVWSDGQLRIVPLGDTPVSNHGVTWSPDLQPIYDLTDDDFLREGEEDPLRYSIKREADAYNYVQVKYQDRSHQYNEQVMPGIDQASIDDIGEKKGDPQSLLHIKRSELASSIAQVLVQRSSLVRRKYKFRLPWNFCLLEPLDLITVSSDRMQVSRQLVRINSIEEDDEGELEIEAEEVLVGVALPAQVERQRPIGYESDQLVAPGRATAPIFINPPRSLTGGEYEVWIATSGGEFWGGAEVWVSIDGNSYERQGLIAGPSRYGLTTTALSGISMAVPEPELDEEGNPIEVYEPLLPPPGNFYHDASVGVSIALSGGELLPATPAELDNLVTLCLVGEEILAYQGATLTAPNQYTLSTLRRSLFGTGVKPAEGTAAPGHPAGSTFVRLDDAVFSLPYREDQIGKTMRVKLRSFNIYGKAGEELDGLPAYTLTLTPNGAIYIPVKWQDIGDIPRGPGDLTDGGDIKTRNVRLPDGRSAQDVFDGLKDIIKIGDDLNEEVRDRIKDILDRYNPGDMDELASSIMNLARDTINIRGLIEQLGRVDGRPVGPVIKEETTYRIEGDAQIIEAVDLVAISVGENYTAILEERNLRIAGDEAEATARQVLAVDVAGNTSAIAQEAQVRADADSAEATARQALAVQVGNNASAILAEQTARADGDSAEAAARLLLAAQVSQNQALFIAEQSVRVTNDAIHTANFTLMGGRNPSQSGWILNEGTVEIGSRGSLLSVLQALIATDDENAAQISQEAIARASGDSANASLINSLSSTVGTNTASITSLLEVTDGLYARAALALNVNGRVTGYEINGATGTIVFAAETFAIASQGPGAAYFPFVIDSVLNKIALTGNVAIYGNLLVTGTVDTPQMANNAISGAYAAYNQNTVVLTNNIPIRIHGAYMNVERAGSPVDIDFNCWGTFTHDAGGSFIAYVQLVRSRGDSGGDVLMTVPIYGSGMANDTWQGSIPMKYLDKPGATGLWHYYVQVYFNVNNMSTQSVTARYARLTELKNNPTANITTGTGSGTGVGSGGGSSGGGGSGGGGGGGMIDPGGGGGGEYEQVVN